MESEPSFPQFRRLPAELRCKIWRLAVPRRTVSVRAEAETVAVDGAPPGVVHWQYRVVCDGPAPPLPRLGLVSHEAYYETVRCYSKPLAIDRGAAVRALESHPPADNDDESATPEELARARLEMAPFSASRDVLEWREPPRRQQGPLLRPVFVAACLSVRHASVAYDSSMHGELLALAAAVLDARQPLETLTVTLALPRYDYCHRFRLAKRPASVRMLGEGDTDVKPILSRHRTCFIPWLGEPMPMPPPAKTETEMEEPKEAEAETQRDSDFFIYEVSSPDGTECNNFVNWFWYVTLYPKVMMGIRIRSQVS
ncbi:hypothetical protein GGR52DRAFT_304791 [Hypoxylon sp. FL1284]|nr:hypothetical protein GGR52DRAFT_304791 [Hypoxylon sp. FL1284]